MSDRPAELPREVVDKILKQARSMIAKELGVTLQEDVNGQWGRMGARYLTVRFTPEGRPDDLAEIHMIIENVRLSSADRYQAMLDREDK